MTNVIGAITWNIENGTLTISGTGAIDNYNAGGAPWYPQQNIITSIVIQDGVTRIGNNAFNGCQFCISVIIPSSITEIGEAAFKSCGSLLSLFIPNSILKIERNAFNDCLNLKTVEIEEKCTGNLRFVGISNTPGPHFENCKIETLFLGRDLETEKIDGAASNGSPFSENPNKIYLKTVTIGDCVKKINDYSFNDCKNLELLTFGKEEKLERIGSFAFNGCSSLVGALNIPQEVEKIGECAFKSCSSLTSLIIPNSVLEIGRNAFSDCQNLKTVRIDDKCTGKLTFVGISNTPGPHFENCKIETLYLGRDLETEKVNGAASNGSPFSNNTYLKLIIIGDCVKEINDYSFYNCTDITQITSYPTTPPKIYEHTFSGVGKSVHNIPVLIDCYYQSTYKTAEHWSEFTNYRSIDTQEQCELGIEDIISPQFVIYPNPTTGELIIENEKWRIEGIRIFDVYGREQKTEKRKQEEENGIQIDISELSTGIYFVRISTEVGEVVRKIVKK